MRYFIGIDVAKFKHTACVIDADGTVLVEPFDFTNDIVGFQSLLKNIKLFLKKKHLVGMEDTGHYGDNLRNFLLDKQYKVVMLNPIVTSHIRKASNKAKNDRIDCFVIANTMMNPNFYRDQQVQSIDYATIRQLTRMHHTHTEEINRYKCQLQKSIDIVFPEFNSLLNTKYSKTYLEILDTYHGAYTIANTDIRLLRNTLKNVGVGRSVSISAEQLKKSAKESIGQHNLAIEMDIPFLVSLIRRLTSILGEIDKKIEELVDKTSEKFFQDIKNLKFEEKIIKDINDKIIAEEKNKSQSLKNSYIETKKYINNVENLSLSVEKPKIKIFQKEA